MCGVILTGGRFPGTPNAKVGVGDLDPGIKAGEETQQDEIIWNCTVKNTSPMKYFLNH